MTVTISTYQQPPPAPPPQYAVGNITAYEIPAAPTTYDRDEYEYDNNTFLPQRPSMTSASTSAYYSAETAPLSLTFSDTDSAFMSAGGTEYDGVMTNSTGMAPYALPPPSSSSSSASSTVPSSRRRYRRLAAVDPSVQRERNVKHNEAEIRRRQRLNGILNELAVIVGCQRPYKSAILRSTLDRVKTLELRLQQAHAHVEQLSSALRDAQAHAHPMSPITHASIPVGVGVGTQSEDLGDSLLSSSCVAMHIADLNGRIVDCNELFALFSGFKRETLINGSLTLLNILSHHSLTDYFASNTRLVTNIHSVQRGECIYHCANGLMRAAAVISWIAANNNKSFVVSIIQPVKTIAQNTSQ
jgi:PAS domain S-box-containing protein